MELISQKTIDLLNYRIQQELINSKRYEQMYLWLQNESYLNAAQLWKKNYEDEVAHSNWAKDYLMAFKVMPELTSIEEPSNMFESFEEIVQKTYEFEKETTLQCRELAKHALEEGDYNLLILANKYNEEQIEEMDSIYTLLDLVKMTSDKLVLELYIKENLIEKEN
jgi:ferritin